MREHRLVLCEPGLTGRITVRRRTYAFQCADEAGVPQVKRDTVAAALCRRTRLDADNLPVRGLEQEQHGGN